MVHVTFETSSGAVEVEGDDFHAAFMADLITAGGMRPFLAQDTVKVPEVIKVADDIDRGHVVDMLADMHLSQR